MKKILLTAMSLATIGSIAPIASCSCHTDDSKKQCYVTIIAGPGGTLGTAGTGTEVTVIPVQSGTRWGDAKVDVAADANHKFVGWYWDNQLITDDTIITQNSYVYAWFERTDTTKCDIRFVAMSGGSFSDTSPSTLTKMITKNTTKWSEIEKPQFVVNDGFKFENWYINNVVPTDDTVFSDTVYCFAYFEKTKVNITINNVEHATIVSPTVSAGTGTFNSIRTFIDKAVKPDVGYVLGGWQDEEGNRIYDNYRVEASKTITPIIIEECNTYKFNTENHTAVVETKTKDQVDLMVPAYIWNPDDLSEPYMVNGIAYSSGGYYLGSSVVRTVCIPDTITVITDRAFSNCTQLVTAYIPKTVTKFCYQCFYFRNSCGRLKNFYFLGTKDVYKNITKSNYWCDGMYTSKTICLDGEVNLNY